MFEALEENPVPDDNGNGDANGPPDQNGGEGDNSDPLDEPPHKYGKGTKRTQPPPGSGGGDEEGE